MGSESSACMYKPDAAGSLGKYDMRAEARPAATGIMGMYGDAKLAVYGRINSNLTTSNVLAITVLLLEMLEITKRFK